MWILYNPNPDKKNIEDCTVRAICKATDKDWDSVYTGLTTFGYILKDMPHANHVWGAYLRRLGFKRFIVDDHGIDRYTVEDFCRDNPVGTFVLGIQGHVVCVVDGNLYDTWDSGNEIPIYYWRRV